MNTREALKYLSTHNINLTPQKLRGMAWELMEDGYSKDYFTRTNYIFAKKVNGKWEFTKEALDAYILAHHPLVIECEDNDYLYIILAIVIIILLVLAMGVK